MFATASGARSGDISRLDSERLVIREERANLRLELDVEAMSGEDRAQAAAVLGRR